MSDDIEPPENVDVLQVAPGNEYHFGLGQTLTTFESSVREVYPMHCWGDSHIVDVFLNEHTEYTSKIKKNKIQRVMRRKEVIYEI